MKFKLTWVLPILLLVGCDSDRDNKAAVSNTGSSQVSKTAIRTVDFPTVQLGFKLYRENCATCHGDQGQGAANWQQAGANGKYPAPPLNGTGHAWHHPMPVLIGTIRNGTQRIGGSMPPWQEKLTDAEIHAIITWFQSRWPDELYQAWERMDREAARLVK